MLCEAEALVAPQVLGDTAQREGQNRGVLARDRHAQEHARKGLRAVQGADREGACR